MDLFASAVASAPFLLLTLVTDTKVFGPVATGVHRSRRGRLDLITDLFVVLALALAFSVGVVELMLERDDFQGRQIVGYGLGVGALGVFLHVGATVWRLHRPPEEP